MALLELLPARQQPQPEGLHLGEHAEARDPELPEVDRREQREGVLAARPLRVLDAEDVLVRDLVERDAGIELGQRRARDHVHVVAGALPLAGEVGGVDALPAAEHVAAIGEERDAQLAPRAGDPRARREPPERGGGAGHR